MNASLSINADGFLRFLGRAAELAGAGLQDNDLRDGFGQAQETYLAEMRERFGAEGDGSWRPLAKVTEEERRYLGFSPAHPILERLGFLYRGLIPGEPGNVFEARGNSFVVGYGGSFRHPGYVAPSGKRVGGDVLLSDIANYHQYGTSRLTARPILVPPIGAVMEVMEVHITNGLRRLMEHAAAA